MGDLSDSSRLWWSSVLQLARDAHAQRSVSSPLDRLKVAPDERPKISEGDWQETTPTSSGTLLLLLGRDGSTQPIVPMDAIIEQLGYKLVWSTGSCKLYPPHSTSIRLRVKNG